MGQMDPALAERSRTIDAAELGTRLRNARVAAGMTQAQVAAGEVSPSYLSRIEEGLRRPEALLLERMAGRMGASLEALLLGVTPDRNAELRLKVDHAELALAAGEPRRALDHVTEVLDAIPDTMPDLRVAALRVRAGALEAAGELNDAIVQLEELMAMPTADAAWLRGLIALSRCYRDSGEFNRAIEVGERAAKLIDDLGIAGLTEAIQLTVTVAGAHHQQGDVEKAKRLCMRAIADAERYDSPIAKASAYWNASILETDTNGATPAAVDMAKKALALFELGEDNRNLAKLRAELANLQLAQDPPDAAAALDTLDDAETALSWSGGSAWEIALVHITRGRALYLVEEFDAADASILRGLELAPEPAPVLRATAGSIRGQIAAALGHLDDARDLYHGAVAALSAVGADHAAAQLWFELANLLDEVGDHEGAVQAFRSAGAATGLRVSGGHLPKGPRKARTKARGSAKR